MISNKSAEIREPNQDRNALVIVLKALFLFIALNLIFAFSNAQPALGRISAYNWLFPGRARLPYGDNPQESYNLSLFNIEAMLASHELWDSPKPENEFRVILIGDSATWGFLLPPELTLTAFLNQENITTPDGKKLRAYNLGYPVMSLTKDLMFLDRALEFDPDLIVWLVTLESFSKDKQLFPPLLQNNPEIVHELQEKYRLNLNLQDANLEVKSFWDRTIIGARRSLADLIRLQLHGVMWSATGIDQALLESFTPRMEDLPEDDSFHEFTPPHLDENDLAFEVLSAGVERVGGIPVLVINEPIFISQGANSDIRYNFYYPRWAFDDYRQMMHERSEQENWLYYDSWDAVDASEFTNSAIHMTPEGTQQFAQLIGEAVINMTNAEE